MKTMSLKKATLYNFISQYSTMFIQIILSMVLARIISPDDYGVIAILIVILNCLSLFSDMGLSVAIVQRVLMSKKEHSQLFSFSITIGLILVTIFCGIAYPVSKIFNDSIYLKVCPLISIVALLNSINTVPSALLIRDKRFDFIAKRNIISTLLSGLLAIIIALLGGGLYALIFQYILNALILLIMDFYCYPLPLNKFSYRGIWNILGSYSAFQLIYNALNYLTRNLDNLLVGFKFGNATLGNYNKAYTLNLYPNAIFTSVITGVIHPFIRDNSENKPVLLSKISDVLKLLSIVGSFVMVVFFWSSKEIIRIMLGANWTESVGCLKMLSICIWAQMLSSVAGSVFAGIERTDKMLQSGIISLILVVSAILVGILSNSIYVLSLGIGIAYNIIFIITYHILVTKCFNASYMIFIGKFIKDLIFAFFCIIITIFIPEFSNDTIISLVIKVGLCSLVFLLRIIVTKELKLAIDVVKKIK